MAGSVCRYVGIADAQERMAAYYEEYVSNLAAQARKEKDKNDKESATLAKLADEWGAWLRVLGAAARKLQAMSDAGDESAHAIVSSGAWMSGAAEGGAEADGAAGAARLAALLVDVAAKSDTKQSALRKRFKELDTLEAECEEKLKKATDKINAHNALTAHRKAPANSAGALGGAVRVAASMKKKAKKGGGGGGGKKATGLPAIGGMKQGADEGETLPAVPSTASCTGATAQAD